MAGTVAAATDKHACSYRLDVRRIFSPRWLALHAFVLLVTVLFARLGWWQWDRARVTGGVQNLIYALQWPSFAAFGIYLWVQTMRDELDPARAARRRERSPAPAIGGSYLPSADDPEDEELAAYNRYLAELNAREEQRQR